jgi:CRP/FNR family cyclic AMP-dependent transcriptional regulator
MRLHKDHKVELISKVPLFASCSKKDLQRVASIADEIDLPEGKVLTRQGAVGREFFVLIEGTVDVVRDGVKLDTMGPGDFFGEVSLVSKRPRNATVTATSPLRALVVTERDFWRLLEDWPQIQSKVLRALADRVAPEQL